MSTCQRIGLPAGFPRKKTFASTVPGFALPHSALRSLARFLSTPRTCPSLNFSQLFSQRTVPGQQGNAGASPEGEADLWGAGGQGTRRNRGGAAPASRHIMKISFQEMHGVSPGRSIHMPGPQPMQRPHQKASGSRTRGPQPLLVQCRAPSPPGESKWGKFAQFCAFLCPPSP